MIVSEIQLFEVLSEQLGREKAKVLVEYVESKVEKELNEKTTVFATKEDIAHLETKIAESKAEMIKWMFIFWAGSVISMIGILFAFVKMFAEK